MIIKLDSLAHLSDIVRSKEEVLEPLVAHFENTNGERYTESECKVSSDIFQYQMLTTCRAKISN